MSSDAERWQRAKTYIEQQIETREFAAKSRYLDRDDKAELRHEIGIYKKILGRAEGK